MNRLLDFVRVSFEWAAYRYDGLFGDWISLHFFVRSTILLLALWLIIFISAQFLIYAAGPIVLLVYYHTIFRAMNYLVTETLHEWLFINRHSKGIHSPMYLRLCDKVRKNRAKLHDATFFLLVKKAHGFFVRVMTIALIGTTLWIAGFGLHAEFFDGDLLGERTHPETGTPNETPPPDEVTDLPEYPAPTPDRPSVLDIGAWPIGTRLYLNEDGRSGVRLRSAPGIDGAAVVEILWGDDVLEFLGTYEEDALVPGLYWIFATSPRGNSGYISHHFVEFPEFEEGYSYSHSP